MAKSLVLVVGAGASSEVGLPVGKGLRGKIADVVDIYYEGGRVTSGDMTIATAIRDLAAEAAQPGINHSHYLRAARHIHDAMPQASSIDNFIDNHRNDPLIAVVGKLAIARCILAAEAASNLYFNPGDDDPRIRFGDVADTWYNAFFQLLCENCAEEELPERFARVAIVCFNYDRCIEHYIHGSLQNYYQMAASEAAELMAMLTIYHPYGTVGALPWQVKLGGVGFGETPRAHTLINLTKALRTFTEGTDAATSNIIDIRQTLDEAGRIAFLGFAFHRQNLQLLYPGPEKGFTVASRPTCATTIGISGPDLTAIRTRLHNLGALDTNVFYPLQKNAAALFGEFKQVLSLV